MRITTLLTAAAAAGAASAASAGVIGSFGYTDLSGSYERITANTGTFQAAAVNSGLLQSSGDVTRLKSPGGTAQFDTGFVSDPDPSDFVILLNFTRTGAMSGTGTGAFTATDSTGDTLTGTISGVWLSVGFGTVYFNGLLSNVSFNDGDAGADSLFASTSGGFAMSDMTGSYSGALVQLFLSSSGGGFMSKSFSGVSTQVSADIVPTPASAALLGLGMLVAMGRGRPRR